MPEVEVWTTVDVELDDFETDDLVEELKKRGLKNLDEAVQGDGDSLLEKIWQARRLGKPYDHLLDEYLYRVLGRAI